MITVQKMILRLQEFWANQGCALRQPYDVESGAGTFHPATFLKVLGPKPSASAFVQPSRRPTDGRYGQNPNRTQRFHQYQVLLKPVPNNFQELYLRSLETLGLDLKEHDIRFVHDDWESPTLGAWGLGWEVWIDGMEVTQFTYFQSVAGQPCNPITGEITYGIERLAMFLQRSESFFDLKWNDTVTYDDLWRENEEQFSKYNFEAASTEMWFRHFQDFEKEAKRLIEEGLALPAHDFVIKASHAFNMLDARHYFSVSERTIYIGRIRNLACAVASFFPHEKVEENLSAPTESLPTLKQERGHLLIELGVEEIPAAFAEGARKEMLRIFTEFFREHNLSYDQIESYCTPRRIALSVQALQLATPASEEWKRGPAVGAPERAIQGFCRAMGLQSIAEAEEREGYFYVKRHTDALSTPQLLQQHFVRLLKAMRFPKSMRWNHHNLSFARPIRWITALIDDQALPLQLNELTATKKSYGHRQRHNQPISLSHANRYLEELRKAFVLADPQERRESIEKQLEAIEAKTGAKAIQREAIIQENLHLTEWPTLAVGSFEERFLQIPEEVCISEMIEHQRNIPLAKERLLPKFVVVADNEPTKLVMHGYETVLSARLADGAFLYEQDLQSGLQCFVEHLKEITYLEGVGSLYDKTTRIKELALRLNQLWKLVSEEDIATAAPLTKADLASEMVGEFPELQGAMGRAFALHEGHSPPIATAIEEHWLPKGERSALPKTPLGILLSSADKLDNLISCFSIGQIPTSSSDPQGLRRQVLGLVRILLKEQLELDLSAFIDDPALRDFITARMKTVFLQKGIAKDEIEAILAKGVDNPYDGFQRITALKEFREKDPRFDALIEVYKRAKGILEGAKKGTFSTELLQEPAEKALAIHLTQLEEKFAKAMQGREYTEALTLIASLQEPLAKLFDEVKILCEDPALRENRSTLIQKVFTLCSELIDFGQLQKST